MLDIYPSNDTWFSTAQDFHLYRVSQQNTRDLTYKQRNCYQQHVLRWNFKCSETKLNRYVMYVMHSNFSQWGKRV